MRQKFINAYMKTAEIFAELSHARRLHVGSIVVKDDRIISIGYNGMPAGWDNNCEDIEWCSADGLVDPETIEELWPYVDYNEEAEEEYRYRLVTKPEVLHAESNAIAKLAKSNESGLGADMFITHSPCIECAKLIFQSGISRVFYKENYRDDAGINFLRASGVDVKQIEGDESPSS